MKIYLPDEGDSDEGFSTSFTFEDREEQSNFASFLNKMDITYLKSKFPVIEDGKVRYQSGFVVPQSDTDEEADEVVVDEDTIPVPLVEEDKKTKKKSKKRLDNNE